MIIPWAHWYHTGMESVPYPLVSCLEMWKTLKYNLRCQPQTQILIQTDFCGFPLSNTIQCGFNKSPVNPEIPPLRISHQDFRNFWIQSFNKMS